MNGTRRSAGSAILLALCLMLVGAVNARAQAAAGGAQDANAKPQYTMAEYNAFQACANDKNPVSQIKCLDDFVAKYPSSSLLNYVYPLYFNAYGAQKNYVKAMEYADKQVALGDKATQLERLQAYYARAFSYSHLAPTDPAATEQAAKARTSALDGLKELEAAKKPDNVADADWDKAKKDYSALFNYVAATAAFTAKDYPNAATSYKALLASNPQEPVNWYRLGYSYLNANPPQKLDGFWAMGHAVALGGPNKDSVRKYLRAQMYNYQQTGCEPLLDSELNELIALAGSTQDRPESYKFPSADDLNAARKDMTIASVIADLKAGGDKAKVTWLASCGLEFPDVPAKVIEVAADADPIVFKAAFVTSQEEFDAATTANMEVKVPGQPEAARIEKDSPFHFTATLETYDPDPAFMIHWDKGKVKAEDIPAEKPGATKKPATPKKPTPKKP